MLRRPDYSALNQPNTRQEIANKATRLKIRAEGGLPRTGRWPDIRADRYCSTQRDKSSSFWFQTRPLLNRVCRQMVDEDLPASWLELASLKLELEAL